MKTISILIMLLLVITMLIGCGSKTPPPTQTTQNTPSQTVAQGVTPPAITPATPIKLANFGTIEISEPYIHKNMILFIISKQQPDKQSTKYITLDEGLSQGKVKISEKEDAQVHRLEIENDSDLPLFLQSGDIVKGGKQDRTIQVSIIIPPHSKMDIPSLCVEQSRWAGTESFEACCESIAPSKEMRLATQKGQQTAVWKEVESIKGEVCDTIGIGGGLGGSRLGGRSRTSSVNEELDDPKVKETVAEYEKVFTESLKKHPDAVGMAFVLNGDINTIEIFQSPKLFEKVLSKLLKGWALESILNQPKEKTKSVTQDEIKDFIAEMEKGQGKGDTYNNNKIIRIENDKGLASDLLDKSGQIIHRQIIKKDNNKDEGRQNIQPQRVNIRGRHSEDSVVSGLIWLAKHQNPDGSWGARTFQNQCHNDKCDGIGDEQFNVGLTGLSMLAFTGAGYTNSSRDTYEGICFGDVVRKGALYLTGIQLADGTFGGVKEGKFMYNQALATYAMADLYALTMDNPAGVIFREPVEKAVKYLLDAQNPGKAWRYQPKDGQNDTAVTGWVAMALKAAEYDNIHIPPEAFAGIKSFYDDVTDPSNGKVNYTELPGLVNPVYHGIIQPSPTAVGIMVRIFIDKKTTDPMIKLGVNQLLSNPPVWDTSKQGIIDYYYWFYASYCLNQYDGPNGPSWNAWNEKMKDVLMKNQRTNANGCVNGSWDPIDRWGEDGGRVYSTAINILTLEVYYRLGIVRLGNK